MCANPLFDLRFSALTPNASSGSSEGGDPAMDERKRERMELNCESKWSGFENVQQEIKATIVAWIQPLGKCSAVARV
ncbi:hypothetical protein E2542_SST16130 [Spatholobus suberectus]|nr:hypothetical protein E2542_SST16130 [Spatholobus suberectus]